jgi:hypothetical protein
MNGEKCGMNRYQLEVAEIDRKHKRLMRALSLGGAALLIVVALWSAGLPPTQWWARARAWVSTLQADDRQSVAESPVPREQIKAVIPGTAPVFDASKPVPGTDSSISATPLTLYLVSTSPGRNKNEGTAQLGTVPSHPQMYSAGAVLANGSQLKEIYADRVVLERGNKTLTLYVANASAGLDKHSKGAQDLAFVGGVPAPSEALILARDDLTDVIRSMPYYENEMFAGIKVLPGQKTSIFSQLGLVAEDVVVSVDGAPIVDASSAADSLRPLVTGAALTVTVRRGAELKTVSLDGQVIVAAQSNSATTPFSAIPSG